MNKAEDKIMSDGLPGDDVTETATEAAGRAMNDLLSGWVDVNERLPFELTDRNTVFDIQTVIVSTRFGDVFPCEFKRGRGVPGSEVNKAWWKFDDYPHGYITHWMPLPKAPS